MWRLETLRAGINRPLAAAVEEILGLFEKTISEYEEKVSRLQEENNEQRELLDAALSPRVVLHRAAFPPELQQLSLCKEELPPEQREWSPSRGQEEPEPPRIKEEEEEFPVKREHDEECTQWFQLHQPQTEEKREAEPVASTSTEQMETEVVEIEVEVDPEDPAAALEPSGAEQLLSSHCSEPETEDSDGGWNETTEPPSDLHQRSDDEESAHQSQTEENREDGGVSETVSSSDPDSDLDPTSAEQTDHSDEDWKETREPQSGVKSQSAQTLRFACPGCQYCFTSQIFLHQHIKKSHSELHVKQLRSGEIRAESLPSAASQPIRTSGTTRTQNARPGSHSCDQCGKTFRWPSRLKLHQRIHSGDRPYQCLQCAKSFRRESHLKVHQLSHSVERPYKCLQCAKSFRTKGVLNMHQRIHTGEKPYHCEQCGKSFNAQYKLREHQRVHTGAKPYGCAQCLKSFTWSWQLKTHHCVQTVDETSLC